MSDIEIITFGCRLNAYESEVMRKHASDAGLGATVIVNTCAVTQESVRQARQAIRRGAPRESARQDRGHRLRRADRSGPLRRHGRGRSRHRQSARRPKRGPSRVSAAATPSGSRSTTSCRCSETAGHLIDGFGAQARAYVQIQNGCDHRCTFCIIPYRPRAVALGAGGRGGGAGAASWSRTAMPRSC